MEKNVHTEISNPAAERSVLGGICKYGQDALVEVEDLLKEKSFSNDLNRVIWRCLENTKMSSVGLSDILSEASKLNLNEYLENKQSLIHLEAICNTPTNLSNIRDHAVTLVKLEFGRDLAQKLKTCYNSTQNITGEESIAEILAEIESSIESLSLEFIQNQQDNGSVSEGLDEYIKYLEENETDHLGIPTGFSTYDECIGGGLRRGCVDVIAARLKQGKSYIGLNIAINVAKKGIPVLILDTEMSKKDFWHRLLSNLTGLNPNYIAKGKFSKHSEHKQKLKEAAKEIKNLPIVHRSVPGKSFPDILSIARRWIKSDVGEQDGERKDALIVYDYLKLMTEDGLNSMSEFQMLGFNMTRLHNFCFDYDVSCLSFVQLNRDGIQKEDTSTISQSDRIGWLATSVSIFKSKTPDEISQDGVNKGNKKLIPLVARHGPGIDDGDYICMNMDGGKGLVKELGKIREINDSFPSTATNEPKEDKEFN